MSEVVDDHSDLNRILEEAVFQDNTAQLNMRIPRAMKAALNRLTANHTPHPADLLGARRYFSRQDSKPWVSRG